MKCRIRKSKKVNDSDVYFVKFLFFNDVLSKNNFKPVRLPVCDWTDDITEATVFKTKKEAERKVKNCRLKNVEYERVV